MKPDATPKKQDRIISGWVLAIDTAMNGCSVAVLNPKTLETASAGEAMLRGQSERLVPMIGEVVSGAGIDKKRLELVAVTVGPGAFTGVRVGLSTARALAVALGIPVVGLCTLDVIRTQCAPLFSETQKSGIAVLIDTKRNDYYCGLYSPEGKPIFPPFAGNEEKVLEAMGKGKYAICGDVAEKFVGKAGLASEDFPVFDVPGIDPAVLAAEGLKLWMNLGDDAVAASVQPLYLREAEVSFPKSKR